jgi:tungstate transport system substrate-binding protein
VKNLSFLTCVVLFVFLVSACAAAPTAGPTHPPDTLSPQSTPVPPTPATGASCNLRLATTTSTADSGLLDFILPDFQKKFNCHVDVVAVGTGQALQIGSKGDADVVLVHARAQEDKFVANGDSKQRFDVMYNDFIIVGPKSDPAKIAGAANAIEAFKTIASAQSPFASRGDQSGTNTKELSIWASAAISPTKQIAWYNSLGQGMGDTLVFANEKQAYTLSDRGTYLSMQSKLPNLNILFGGNALKDNKDKTLLNPYGVMAVNPDKHPGVQFDLAMKFVNWILSADTQKLIGSYGVDKFGQPLFYPNAKPGGTQ